MHAIRTQVDNAVNYIQNITSVGIVAPENKAISKVVGEMSKNNNTIAKLLESSSRMEQDIAKYEKHMNNVAVKGKLITLLLHC